METEAAVKLFGWLRKPQKFAKGGIIKSAGGPVGDEVPVQMYPCGYTVRRESEEEQIARLLADPDAYYKEAYEKALRNVEAKIKDRKKEQ